MRETFWKSFLGSVADIIERLFASAVLGMFMGFLVTVAVGGANDSKQSIAVIVAIFVIVLFLGVSISMEVTLDNPDFILMVAKMFFLWGGTLVSVVLAVLLKDTNASELFEFWLIAFILWTTYVVFMRIIPSRWREKWGIFLEERVTSRRSQRRSLLSK